MASEKQKIMEVELRFAGIAKRDRKVKNHRIELATLDQNENFEPTAELIETALQKLESYKSVTRAKICTRFTEVEKCDGYSMIGFAMFDKRNKSWDV